jgi:diguanylate cyclase (GGDEF)-like protein
LPGTSLSEAGVLAERLRSRVQCTPLMHGQQPIAMTLSLGASVISAGDAKSDLVLARADQALYAAKSDGRNLLRLLAPS